MSRKARQTLFWSFFIIFVLVSPSIVLYARGYRFDFVKKKFVATGAIFIKSEPPGASVFVNGQPRGETSGTLRDALTKSSLISNMLPGEYDVRVEMPGYMPWVKKLSVRPKQVTEARNVYLFAEGNKPKNVYFGEITDSLISPDGKTAAIISETEATTSMVTVDIATKERKIVYAATGNTNAALASKNRSQKLQTKKHVLSLQYFSPDSRYLLATDKYGDTATSVFVLADLTKPDKKPLIASWKWGAFSEILSVNSGKLLISDSKNSLKEWQMDSNDPPATISASSWGATFSHGNAYFLEGQPPMLKIRSGKTSLDALSQNPVPVASGTKFSLQVEPLAGSAYGVLAISRGTDSGTALLLDENGDFSKLRDEVFAMQASPDGKKLLERTRNELWVYYTDDVLTQPIHRKGEQTLVARFGRNIKDSRWLPQSSDYVAYAITDGFFAIELDDRGTVRNNAELVRNGDITIVALTKDAAYFTAQKNLLRFAWKPEPKDAIMLSPAPQAQ